jgi:hypothetical protein
VDLRWADKADRPTEVSILAQEQLTLEVVVAEVVVIRINLEEMVDLVL